VIACIVLNTDNSLHFVLFSFVWEHHRSKIDRLLTTSLAKFLSVSGPVVRESLGSADWLS